MNILIELVKELFIIEIANTAKEMTPFTDINVKYEDMELCGTSKKAWQERWTELFNAAQ